jgi:hypothetical protein
MYINTYQINEQFSHKACDINSSCNMCTSIAPVILIIYLNIVQLHLEHNINQSKTIVIIIDLFNISSLSKAECFLTKILIFSFASQNFYYYYFRMFNK